MLLLRTKTKLLVPMFSLVAILIFLSALVISYSYYKIITLQELKEKVIFGAKVASTIHSLQKERGLSCGYVVNPHNDKFKKELQKQKKITDTEIRNLQLFLNVLSCKRFKKSIQQSLFKVSQLHIAREDIAKYNVTYSGVIKYYSYINESLLDLILRISQDSHVPLVTKDILTYRYFLNLKEYKGIERAEGVIIFSKQKLSRKSLIELSNTLSIEKLNEKTFLKYASSVSRHYYKHAIKDPSFKEVSKMEDILIYRDISKHNIDPKYWYTTITQNLNIFEKVSLFIQKETLKDIDREINSVRNVFILVTILTLISIFIFFLMLIAFFKLIRDEQRLRIVMDKYIISSTTDLQGRIIDVSEAFCNISGYSRKELLGKQHNLLRHPDMPKEVFKELWYKITHGHSWRGKIKNKKKDGSFYWVYANVEPLFTSKGNIDSYISVRLDITESELLLLKIKEEENKNRLQEELIKEQARLIQMGEMISMIAHQWRQPLSAIAAASGAIYLKATRDSLSKEIAIELSEKIKNFSMHLSQTIDDFRNFFKPNKMKSETDFSQIIESVLSIIEISLEKNKITLEIEIRSTLSFVTFENELKQVILNLVKNAEDALVEKEIQNPTIQIVIDKNRLSISDNAGGIPEDIIEKIFDPYFSTKKKKDGTGLGLYMSKMIIEEHCNGRLQVTNENSGANFTIILGEDND